MDKTTLIIVIVLIILNLLVWFIVGIVAIQHPYSVHILCEYPSVYGNATNAGC